MSDKIYVGAVGVEIRLDTFNEDLASATSIKIAVKKPDGTEVEWTAAQYSTGTKITYTTVAGDFNVAGDYSMQAYVAWGTSPIALGETYVRRIYEEYG